MRSKLFVPGSRPELFAKALAGDADALSIDLEDAVPEERKGQARAAVAAFLESSEAVASSKAIIVRVNALGTPHFEADVEAVAHRSLAMLNLPKTESADDVRACIAALGRVSAASGVRQKIRILANIETPQGLRRAAEIAGAHPRVAGLQLGYADLFAPHGIERHDAANVHAAMFVVRMAAAEAGVFAYDGAYADVQDAKGFRAEAAMARRLGFWGKSCVHPKQVPLANEIFSPSDPEIAEARRIVEASRAAAAQGLGAFTLDGRMIDAPVIRRAEALVEMGRRLGQVR
jgi:citrate lyase subunit beta/citryl-CoA lyase